MSPQRRRLRLIVSPVAASVTRRSRQAVVDALVVHAVSVVETTEPDHATALARVAAADGLMEAGTGTTLVPLPAGSKNLFARTSCLPRKPRRAAPTVATALERGLVRHIPVGLAKGRGYPCHVGLGFDPSVVSQVERRPQLERTIRAGHLHVRGVRQVVPHYNRRRPRFRVESADGSQNSGLGHGPDSTTMTSFS